MMLTQVSLPVCAFNHERQVPTAGCPPTESIATGSDVKATSTHRRNRAAVVETSKHVIKRDAQIVLAKLHQRGSSHDLASAVSNLWIMNQSLRLGHGQKWTGRVHSGLTR